MFHFASPDKSPEVSPRGKESPIKAAPVMTVPRPSYREALSKRVEEQTRFLKCMEENLTQHKHEKEEQKETITGEDSQYQALLLLWTQNQETHFHKLRRKHQKMLHSALAMAKLPRGSKLSEPPMAQ
eukprot:TRINITY_DN7957_c0_g1_i1.p1 TRINITY_DN7957_c0_g1~~TRINITY_DN7957_c0_g1_i1.p1  ORF type:complete len:127 (+),score=4.54 TRINITY_DN7957_c0_g1_i1:54-434(+)